MKYLGNPGRLVTLFPKISCQGGMIAQGGILHTIAPGLVNIPQDAIALGIESAHERGTRGAAQGELAIGPGKTNPFSRQLVQVGRVLFDFHVGPDPGIQVVGNYKQDIGFLSGEEGAQEKQTDQGDLSHIGIKYFKIIKFENYPNISLLN